MPIKLPSGSISSSRPNKKLGAIIGGVIGALIFFFFLVFVFVFLYRRRKEERKKVPISPFRNEDSPAERERMSGKLPSVVEQFKSNWGVEKASESNNSGSSGSRNQGETDTHTQDEGLRREVAQLRVENEVLRDQMQESRVVHCDAGDVPDEPPPSYVAS